MKTVSILLRAARMKDRPPQTVSVLLPVQPGGVAFSRLPAASSII
ncbi:hypothetical protein TGS27_1657 [Geobacillus stearothermophilus]|uniref:Uncharacterized protein n=1 Tax=Geobacillus stearothermophilus TaxID=1422 RepID=A0A150NAS1_GEOSE|nr:hypothetical protein B4114_2827 [Geobacillus stearothermophilus]OAO81278.1 hypothetical protein TGS27_1657 [Geobacillus stearothermophilus]